MTKTTAIDVAIIGAGIIGVSIAFKLQEAGRTTLLIDRKGIAEETSRGNAGAFAFSDVIPMATSGILGKLPRWLSDPLGPLTIRPEYLLPITPWLLRFWRAGWPDRVTASLKAQSAMMRLARAEALTKDVRSTVDLISAQRSVIDQVLERSGTLAVQTRQAEGLIESLRAECVLATTLQGALRTRRDEEEDADAA